MKPLVILPSTHHLPLLLLSGEHEQAVSAFDSSDAGPEGSDSEATDSLHTILDSDVIHLCLLSPSEGLKAYFKLI